MAPSAHNRLLQERLPEIFDGVADGVTVLDRHGIVRFANTTGARLMGAERADRIIGHASAEVLGNFELLDEDGSPMPVEELPTRRALAGEATPEAVLRFRTRGTLKDRWSIVRARLLRGTTPDEDLVVTAFQDITALKRSELRLSILSEASAILGQSTDYEATLARVAQVAVPRLADWCVVDVAESGREPHRVAVAHSDPEMLAFADDVQRRWPSSANPNSGLDQVMQTGRSVHLPEVTDEMLRAGSVDDEHYDALRRLGIRSALVVPLVARGEVLGALSLIDSTSQRDLDDDDVALAEELGRRAGAAIDAARLVHDRETAVRERDEFVAVASHDMRTPLAAISGYAQLAQRHLAMAGEMDRAALDRWIGDISSSADRLTRLVTNLMDASLLRGGRSVPLYLQPTDLVQLVKETIAEHRGTAGERISLEVEVEPVTGSWDPMRLARVVDNLLGNAEKYSPVDAPIEVRVGTDGAWAVLTVTDHGIGIPPGDLRRIFTRNYRARNARGVAGTGLGLTGSERLIRQMSGRINVDSRLGEGSTFTVRLPLGSPAPAAERRVGPEEEPQATATLADAAPPAAADLPA